MKKASLCLLFLTIPFWTFAKQNKKHIKHPERPKAAALVLDADNGKILHSHNANIKVYPASLTKMMTIYETFRELKSGKIKLSDKILISQKAANMPASKLYLNKGELITVEKAIKALVVKSANDVAVAVAEHISKSQESFAKRMTLTAKAIGMRNTIFKNASGWDHPEQRTTAVDMAKLCVALKRDFPEYHKFLKATSFEHKGHIITTHNRVAKNYPWSDGGKTGFTSKAGYNLVSAAVKDGKRLVAVVLGAQSSAKRDSKIIELLDYHFAEKVKIASSSKNKIVK